jgi:hypothetical protein
MGTITTDYVILKCGCNDCQAQEIRISEVWFHMIKEMLKPRDEQTLTYSAVFRTFVQSKVGGGRHFQES